MLTHFNIDIKKCSELTNVTSAQTEQILCYPTVVSTNDIIKIYNASENVNVSWFDIKGTMLKNNEIHGNEISIPDNLQPGIYFLKIQDGTKQVTQKIIISH
ncbi:MAG: T9SS type A sorting domain-containing protein [Saprospiraceae bacterium]|nr:T9SS type A sorting domain-containing protein [Saprospiraceae bacterium]